MRILLNSIGVRNAGAELMANAILQHFKGVELDLQFAVEPRFGTYEERARYGVATWLKPFSLSRSWVIARLMTPSFRRVYGLVDWSEIDAIVDAAGFRYSDQWGPHPIEQYADLLKRWRKPGRKVVLMPQAFGPFEQTRTRTGIAEIISCSDLVFARDKRSYEHLRHAGADLRRVHIAPDFTNLVRGVLPPDYSATDQDALIVPNMRMLDKTSSPVKEQYLVTLVACLKEIQRLGLRPVVLLHTTEEEEIVPLLRASAVDFEVVRERDPIALKGIIGTARFLIGSRFHALVSALAQGVPALGTGWSHKYRQLFRDYGFEDGLINLEAGPDAAVDKIALVNDEDARTVLIEQLIVRGNRLRAQTHEMWKHVDAILGVTTGATAEASSVSVHA